MNLFHNVKWIESKMSPSLIHEQIVIIGKLLLYKINKTLWRVLLYENQSSSDGSMVFYFNKNCDC